MGRLTLNPIAHFDPIGALLLLVAGFGWAKPTPVNPYNLHGGRYGEGIVAAAGPISNLVLASAAALPLRYIVMTEMSVPRIFEETLYWFVVFNVILFVFNLIPIPPLDGSQVLFSLLEARRLDVLTVPLAALADAYLDALASLPGERIGNLSAFVAIASQLILIKSRAMLPRRQEAPSEDLAEDAPDPEAELRARLVLYRADRDAGMSLQAHALATVGLFRREPSTAQAAGLAGARPA